MELDRSAIDQLLGEGVESGAFHGVSGIVVDRDGVLFAGGAGECARTRCSATRR